MMFQKLVRDNIPAIIEKNGETCVTRKLSDKEYEDALAEKLKEEVAELLEAYTAKQRSVLDCAEEISDVMEVLYAFVNLLVQCNPNVIELLGNDPKLYVNMTPEGQMLLDNKELFLTRRIAYSYGGFANDQLRRLQMGLLRNGTSPEALKNKFEKRSLERLVAGQGKDDVFEISISEEMDAEGKHPLLISGSLNDYPVNSLKSLLRGLTTTIDQYEQPQHPKAQKDAVHINKHAMHLVRLYYTAFDILEQGRIITRRDKEHEELLAIRNGKYMREDGSYAPEFFEFVDQLETKFQRDVKKTELPAKPDFAKIEELLVEINKSYLHRIM